MTHYITDNIEMISYVPLSEITKDDRISVKWMVILGVMRLSWEIGDIDIYALVKGDEFALCNDRLKIPPLDSKDSHMDFRMAEAKELNLLINDL